MWIATANGLYSLNTTTQKVQHYTEADGLPSKQFSTKAALSDQNGMFVFGTNEGIATFFPEQIKPYNNPPSVFIDALLVNDAPYKTNENIDLIKTIALPFSDNSIVFSLVALEYADPQNNQIEYFLEGQDKSWIVAPNPTTARYANLSEGTYQFLVKTKNAEGFYNPDIRRIALKILPPWYRSWWFVCLLFCGAFFLIRAYLKMTTTQALALQKAEFDKQQALNQERNRLARDMHDDISSGLSAINLLANYIKNTPLSTDTHLEIKHIAESSTELNQRIREIIWSVSGDSDNVEGLVHFLKRYVSEFGDMQHIDTQFIAPDNLPNLTLKNNVKRHLFLCVKEALNNAVKYAHCTLIDVAIDAKDNNFSLIISDNGIGFNVENALKQGGNGLKNIQERMREMGGEASFLDEKGSKVILTCKI